MPLQISSLKPADTISWVSLRSKAYYGPTHDVLHTGPVRYSSVRGIAEDKKRELGKPNIWHWKIVDTNLRPDEHDPPDNGGHIIAVAVWSMHNVKEEENEELGSVSVESEVVEGDDDKPFIPPELRLDVLDSLVDPLRAAQVNIMGSQEKYLMLSSLATHPDHQRRGAGRMLVDWGLEKADDEGLRIYLDCSQVARSMYEKRGFELVGSTEWDREPWGGKGKDWHGHMIREPNKR